MLHNLGFVHEQTRPDRDDHVLVVWANIQHNRADQYFKNEWATTPVANYLPACPSSATIDAAGTGPSPGTYSACSNHYSAVTSCGKAYDYQSIMHYGSLNSG